MVCLQFGIKHRISAFVLLSCARRIATVYALVYTLVNSNEIRDVPLDRVWFSGIPFACLCLEQGIYSLDFWASPLE